MSNYLDAYELIEERFIKEEASTAYLLEHKKTKARVLYLKNQDPNKVFIIGFRTPPLGSTGNCHILEHCVLNGSRKYQTKEPFMDLLKSSLQTFLNAMTYPDRTLYPIASRNDADFANLMDLYLDAVFYPRAVEDPYIFRQEGWRYEIFDRDEAIQYQGVVYNEMKGAMSSADDQVSDHISQKLYEGSIYAENSGGDPYAIPDLSFEDFKKYHEDFYHPSNSWTFLYGAIDEEDSFGRLNEYFEDFEAKKIDSQIGKAPRLKEAQRAEMDYSVGPSQSTENQTFLTQSWLFEELDEEEKLLVQLLPSVLINSEASPLRQALLKNLDCEDVYGQIHSAQETGFSIIAKNTNPDQAASFQDIIQNYLETFAREGMEKKLILGELQSAEYSLREKGNYATKGIVLGLSAFSDWLYGANPLDRFEYTQYLDALREDLDQGIFEKAIQRHMIENPHQYFILHQAKPGLNASKDEKVKEELEEFKASLSDKELEDLVARNQLLLKRQNSSDTSQQKETIPKLEKNDLPREIESIPRLVKKEGSIHYLGHPLLTSGIHYLNLVFDVNHIGQEDAFTMGLLCNLMGMLDTKRKSYSDYATEESLVTGGIYTSPRLFRNEKQKDDFQRTIIVSSKFLGLNTIQAGLDLIYEQIFETLFEDKDRILEVLKMLQASFQSSLVSNGHQLMRNRAMASIDPLENLNQEVNGITAYQKLKEFIENFDENSLGQIRDLYKRIFASENILVNITSDEESIKKIQKEVSQHLDQYPKKNLAPVSVDFSSYQSREAFISSTDVQFVSAAIPFAQDAEDFDGKLLVLQKLLSNEYLYNEIRAKGGAYGAGLLIGTNKVLSTYSYRDPNLLRTIDTYKNLGDVLTNLQIDQEDLKGFIIGAIGSLDQPLTEKQKGYKDMANFLMNRDPAYENKLLQDMVETEIEDLKNYATDFAPLKEMNHLAVLGKEEKILEVQDRFDRIYHI